MKVKDAMSKTPVFCRLETNLGSAVEMLWNHNCGMLPVVDAQRQVVGVITDRDIAIALGTRNQLPKKSQSQRPLRVRSKHASQRTTSTRRSMQWQKIRCAVWSWSTNRIGSRVFSPWTMLSFPPEAKLE